MQNKLAIYGIEEPTQETKQQLAEKVVDGIFKAKLNIDVSRVERIHRFRRIFPDKPGPVILQLHGQDSGTKRPSSRF